MDSIQELAAKVSGYVEASSAKDGGEVWGTWEPTVPAQTEDLPDCDYCHNQRYVRLRIDDVTDPRFGKLLPCPKCADAIARRNAIRRFRKLIQRIDRYGIIPNFDSTFEAFRTEGRPSSAREALEAARQFVKMDRVWLLLWGAVGTGKTHLAMAAANWLRDRQKTVLLATVPGFLDLLRSGYDDDNNDYTAILNMAKSVEYLLLDDLGTENATPWAREKLFDIINHRYNHTPPLPVMVTTNEPPRKMTPRLASRFGEPALCKTIHLEGSDYRQQKGPR